MWRIWCRRCEQTFSFFSLALLQWVHCSTLLVNTDLMQICYKQKTQVEKESSQVFFFSWILNFSSIFKNQSPPNSLPPSVHSLHLPQKWIFTYVLRHLKRYFPIKSRCQTPFFFFVYNVHKSNKHRLNKEKKKKKNMACLMMLAYWMPFLIVISFDAGFATAHPPRGLGLLGCRVQVGIGLLGDSVWANWA